MMLKSKHADFPRSFYDFFDEHWNNLFTKQTKRNASKYFYDTFIILITTNKIQFIRDTFFSKLKLDHTILYYFIIFIIFLKNIYKYNVNKTKEK